MMQEKPMKKFELKIRVEFLWPNKPTAEENDRISNAVNAAILRGIEDARKPPLVTEFKKDLIV